MNGAVLCQLPQLLGLQARTICPASHTYFLCIYVHTDMGTCSAHEARRRAFPGADVTGSWEPPDVGAGSSTGAAHTLLSSPVSQTFQLGLFKISNIVVTIM